jgi:hypothetical protein
MGALELPGGGSLAGPSAAEPSGAASMLAGSMGAAANPSGGAVGVEAGAGDEAGAVAEPHPGAPSKTTKHSSANGAIVLEGSFTMRFVITLITVAAACSLACGEDFSSSGAGGSGADGSGAGATTTTGQGAGGGSSGNGGGPAACGEGTVGSLVDDFQNDAVTSEQWFKVDGDPFVEVDTTGQLKISISGDNVEPSQPRTGELVSIEEYQLTGCRIVVEVPDTFGDAYASIMWMAAVASQGVLETYVSQGEITFHYIKNGTAVEVASLPYNAAEHRYWMIKEHSGNVSWETSPDGSQWELQGSAQTPFPLDQVNVQLAGGVGGALDGTVSARFDHFNTPR